MSWKQRKIVISGIQNTYWLASHIALCHVLNGLLGLKRKRDTACQHADHQPSTPFLLLLDPQRKMNDWAFCRRDFPIALRTWIFSLFTLELAQARD
jgi:hypothetical protein